MSEIAQSYWQSSRRFSLKGREVLPAEEAAASCSYLSCGRSWCRHLFWLRWRLSCSLLCYFFVINWTILFFVYAMFRKYIYQVPIARCLARSGFKYVVLPVNYLIHRKTWLEIFLFVCCLRAVSPAATACATWNSTRFAVRTPRRTRTIVSCSWRAASRVPKWLKNTTDAAGSPPLNPGRISTNKSTTSATQHKLFINYQLVPPVTIIKWIGYWAVAIPLLCATNKQFADVCLGVCWSAADEHQRRQRCCHHCLGRRV